MADASKTTGRRKAPITTKPETMTPASRKSRVQNAKPAATATAPAAAGTSAATAPAVKRPRSPKRASPAAGQAVAPVPVSVEMRYQMIEREAYYRAERRGFAPGDTLRDWFEAEAEIDRILRGD
jgi:hypothetical protein